MRIDNQHPRTHTQRGGVPPTFLLLLGRRAAGGLVAGLLGHRDGGDDAGLAAQPPLLLLLLQVLQDVLGPLVGAGHRPRREGFLGGGDRKRDRVENKKRTRRPVEKHPQGVASSRLSATDLRNMANMEDDRTREYSKSPAAGPAEAL